MQISRNLLTNADLAKLIVGFEGAAADMTVLRRAIDVGGFKVPQGRALTIRSDLIRLFREWLALFVLMFNGETRIKWKAYKRQHVLMFCISWADCDSCYTFGLVIM
ncbi:hypothetical protein Taro_049692 [Colocasia esculenta]|uniref:Uncharacterized protein n=1 Tax=Colocasia esculenta TaxID=4460 RepID=A0A843XBR1_COLES|nr:hypothetical protein [Colocasia esculenta]